ncbi:uncharacterized protein BCR38DRAFT_481917 [Pseudomassariella vexata]|uniref:Uncharacterized protein n=1 Tax=Pseudomassariella vexata TaxID=1141098 RepID=A0A1Y2EAL0_9PEZI|nr:uncharacterized protein BCR38DRAFT_481917 [Pseudomassariella vexata]ORY68427.1 hypothetical protein BCR38DRAFT_481917 [Pseudomassariella vexata]
MAGPHEAHDAAATDPTLLKDNSELKSYLVGGFDYRIRVFYRRHPKADELPTDPAPLPLLVFIHGLGGSVAQFHPLLCSLSNNGSCLAIDLPGCGRSDFAPTLWDAYTTDALVKLLEHVIEDYRDKENRQGVVLIAHSMGTALAARLANKRGPHTTPIASNVLGIVGICPMSGPLSEKQVTIYRRLLWVPSCLFNLWRWWDQRGGPESASVRRFLGPEADPLSRELQNRYNKQSRTPVFRRMAWGSLPVYIKAKPTGGLFGEATWAGLDIPVFLVGGEKDTILPPQEVDKIAKLLESDDASPDTNGTSSTRTIVDSAMPVVTSVDPRDHLPKSIDTISDKDFVRKNQLKSVEENYEDPSTPRDTLTPHEALPIVPPQPLHPRKMLRTLIMPAPANHALLFVPKTVRVLSGLMCDFLSQHITGRFELGWQLQHLSREGKWDVKNLGKWKKVQPVSEPIEGIFRAMKTLREVDEEHSPKELSLRWGSVIKDVLDISHDNPVYDPQRLENNGIKYHKYPTVSKLVPADEEVETFIKIIDLIREDQTTRAKENDWQEYYIGVHCHYGFNRTGYFIVCYLVERCGLTVEKAIDVFAKARPNGIRHAHFLDKLFQRYSGLKE